MPVNKDMNILVVDDYGSMLRLLRNLLEQLGFHNIDEATDGNRAWELIGDKDYGLILSDWKMEPMDGLELLKLVRDTERTKETPFVMVTAEARGEYVVSARHAGVNNYVVKPFTLAILKQKLQAVIGAFD